MEQKGTDHEEAAMAFDLPVKVVDRLYALGLIGERIMDDDEVFLDKFGDALQDKEMVIMAFDRLSVKEQKIIVETVGRDKVERWVFARYSDHYRNLRMGTTAGYLPVRKVMAELCENFKCEVTADLEKTIKRMRQRALDCL
ncbi:MAG: hypothetical protein JRC86_13480, partial [Deltaproteobacteria bacterium]|nr:hypothetical protein [Deltaproteobacteria bacterium]